MLCMAQASLSTGTQSHLLNSLITARPAPELTAPGISHQVEPWFLVPGWGPRQGGVQRFALLNMPQDLVD
jgi:hypothetical protein